MVTSLQPGLSVCISAHSAGIALLARVPCGSWHASSVGSDSELSQESLDLPPKHWKGVFRKEVMAKGENEKAAIQETKARPVSLAGMFCISGELLRR